MNISSNQPTSLTFIEKAQQKREEESEKLSSGLKINQAADDAAGLQIANRLTSEINGLNQLANNSRDQINLNDIESAQLSSITNNLQRANELAVQSGNPLYSGNAIQGELDQISGEINAIAEQALGDSDFISGLDATDPASSIATIETALSSISDQSSSLGAQSNALTSQVNTYEVSRSSNSTARSQIQDTDYASSTSDQQKNDILLQAALITKNTEEERQGLLIDQLI